MAIKKSTERGARLTEVREKLYENAAVAAMELTKQGCSIKYRRYKDLENGEWPRADEFHHVCKLFKIPPLYWLTGEKDDSNRPHCDTLQGLPPKLRSLTEELVAVMKTKGKELDLWE